MAVVSTLPAFSQCGSGGVEEVGCLYDSLLKQHQHDEFYLHIRPMPGVRVSIEDYVLTKDGGKWTGKYLKKTFDPPPRVGTNRTRRKEIVTVSAIEDSSMNAFLALIDLERLISFKNSDSILLDNSKLPIGTPNYFILICSMSNVRLIEYPVVLHYDRAKDWKTQNIYWQSDFLDNLITVFKRRFQK